MAQPLTYEVPLVQHQRRLGAILVLVLCCLLWGYSFPTMQIATAAMDRCLPGSSDLAIAAHRAAFNGIRFTFASLLYLIVVMNLLGPRRRDLASAAADVPVPLVKRAIGSRFCRADLLGGATVGAFFTGGMLLQILGLRWTLPSVSGFLTAVAVVFAPLAQALVLRRRVGGATWLAMLIAIAGMVLLSMPNPDSHTARTLAAVPPIPHLGEILTVASAMVFTAQIIAVDHYGQTANPVRLTFVMLAFTGVASLVIAAALEGPLLINRAFAAAVTDPTLLWTLGTLVLFSSVIALHLMNTFQPLISPAAASIIYCTEPIFATLFSLGFGAEKLTTLTIFGGLTVLAGVLVVARKG